MRPLWSSALWLELLGGILIVLGVLLAWLAFALAGHPVDSNLDKALLRVKIDFPDFLHNIARSISSAGAALAGVGAVLFFGAGYLVMFFRVVLGVAALAAVGVWVWLAF